MGRELLVQDSGVNGAAHVTRGRSQPRTVSTMNYFIGSFTDTVDRSRIPYHRTLENEALARGDVHAERRAAQDAEKAEAARLNDESRGYRELLAESVATWPPLLQLMVFGG